MTRTRFFIDADKSDEEILAALEEVDVSKHLPGQHDQKTHGRRGQGSSESTDLLVLKLATDLHNRAQTLEPGITDALNKVAQPGDFRKLEFKVKSISSIESKIRNDAAVDVLLDHEGAAKEIRDLNRYLLVWEAEESFKLRYEALNERLSEDGWELYDEKDKNGFKVGDHYQGFNVQYTKGGEFTEIQFHTPDTFAAKLVSDPLYADLRDADKAEHREIAAEIFDIWNPEPPLKVPPNYTEFGTPHDFTIVAKQIVSDFMKRVEYWVFSTAETLTPRALFEVTRGGDVNYWDPETASFLPSPISKPTIDGLGGSTDYYRVGLAFAQKFMKEHTSESGLQDLYDSAVSEEPEKFSVPVKVVKSDEPKNLVFGWASVAFTPDGKQIVDKQGHAIDIEDLESTAYDFTVNSYGSGDMHSGEGFGELVESMVLTKEKAELMGIPPGTTPEGWWVGFRVPPEYHEQVRSGERTMFSIEGTAKLEPFDS